MSRSLWVRSGFLAVCISRLLYESLLCACMHTARTRSTRTSPSMFKILLITQLSTNHEYAHADMTNGSVSACDLQHEQSH